MSSTYGVLGVDGRLILSSLPDQPLSILSEGNNRGSCPITLIVWDDLQSRD